MKFTPLILIAVAAMAQTTSSHVPGSVRARQRR